MRAKKPENLNAEEVIKVIRLLKDETRFCTDYASEFIAGFARIDRAHICEVLRICAELINNWADMLEGRSRD